MKYILLLEILKYLDLFGTNFNFYTERNRKFYTPFGGVLTLLSIVVGTLVFIFMNIEDFLHDSPISTTSTSRVKSRNIKFIEEKIWIPWRIRDYNGKTIKHDGLFYPIPYYYRGRKNYTKNALDLSYDILNYTLCSKTSMINYTDSFIIDLRLDQLYCIDMEELDMGGSWDGDFINYVEFDLYSCKNGIDYDEKNPNCTTYEEIIEAAQEDNSFEFEIYYPVVHYQPMNKTVPVYIKYSNYFYHLSQFSNKIDRIYLQQFILKDDNGWVIRKESSSSHWGQVSLNGDSYATGHKRDLMNEGSSSRFYSFNIYLKSDVVYYNRSYKKLFLIFTDGLPIVNVIFIIFKLIAKVFKVSSGNKKLTELLFENLQEKIALRLNKKKITAGNKISTPKHFVNYSLHNNNKFVKNNTTNNNINDASSIQLSSNKSFIFKNMDKRKNSLDGKNNNHKSKYFQNINNPLNSNNLNINYENVGINNSNINININNNNIGDFSINKSNGRPSMIQLNKTKIKKKFSIEDKNRDKDKNSDRIMKTKFKKSYVQRKLFPYKYYLCSIFIKNIDITKKSVFFTRKFIVVYNFICQLFDISSYLILQREFQILKSTLMIRKYRDVLENRQKINVNDHSFNTDMKECLDSHKFSILGRIKNSKSLN